MEINWSYYQNELKKMISQIPYSDNTNLFDDITYAFDDIINSFY